MDTDAENKENTEQQQLRSEDVNSKKRKLDSLSEDDEDDAGLGEADTNTDSGVDDTGGRVIRIEAVDFMCHRHMQVDLGSKINFITGPNGSGKSAIIAALQVCLGMNAKSTNRAGKLRGFIRDGSKGNAIVKVTLDNTGSLAFKPEEYGDSITIERTIRHSGGSGYRLLDHKGVKVTDRKMELNQIVENYNLFVNNPCCILDQENSKLFLKGDEKDKNDFFLKASMLEKMKNEYARENETRKLAKAELKRRRGEIQNLVDDVTRAKQHLDSLQSMKKIQDEHDRTEQKIFWRAYFDQKQEYDDKDGAMRKAIEKKKLLEEKLEEFLKSSSDQQAEENRLEAEITRVSTKIDHCKCELNDARMELGQAKEPIKEYKRLMQELVQEINKGKANIRTTQAKIDDIRRREAQNNPESEKERLINEISQIESELNAVGEGNEEEDSRIIERAYEEKIQHNECARKSKESIRRTRDKIEDFKQQLHNLHAQQKDSTARFGVGIPRLLHAIERENRFHRKPLHIGLNIELKDPTFERVISQALREAAKSFTVTDGHDMVLLRKLAKSCNIHKLNIVVQKFLDRRHNITTPEDSSLVTVESQLHVKDDNVFNALVDQARMESTILFEDPKEARAKMFIPAGNGLVKTPKFVYSGLDVEGNQYHVNRGSDTIMHYKLNNNSLFSADCTEEIQHVESMIEKVKHEASIHQREEASSIAKVRECENTINSVNRKGEQLRKKKHALNSKRSKLVQRLDKLSDNQSAQELAKQADYITQTETVIQDMENERLGYVQKVQEIKTSFPPLEEKVSLKESELSKLQQESERCNEQLIEYSESIQRFQLDRSKLENKLLKRTEIVQALEEECDTLKQKTELLHESAVEMGGEVMTKSPNRTVKRLQNDLVQLEERIAKEKQRFRRMSSNKSPEEMIVEAEQDLIRCTKRVENSQKLLDSTAKRLQHLRESNKKRQGLWREFRGVMQRKTTQFFTYYLSRRNYGGTIEFDDNRLVVKWSKHMEDLNDYQASQIQHDTNESQMITDTKSLSGGERSYTTICLLLAMGTVVDTPFRVMDEFDVFMDEVNRKAAMKQLIEAATSDKRQYILVTPHSIGDVHSTSDIRRIRMKPPVEDYGRFQQQSLNFQRA